MHRGEQKKARCVPLTSFVECSSMIAGLCCKSAPAMDDEHWGGDAP